MRGRIQYFFHLLVAGTIALAIGCGDDGGVPDAGAEPDAAAGCSAELPDPLPQPNGDLAGTWALFSKFYANVQGFGGAQISRSFYLQEYTQFGEMLNATETLCTIEVDSEDGGTQIRLGPGYASSQPVVSRNGTLVPNNGGFDIDLTTSYQVRGIDLADELNDPLPTDIADPRIVDEDGDGNPGLTLLVDGLLSGQLYTIQRDFNGYSGTQTAEDRIDGLGTWGNELIYLATNPDFLIDLVNPALPDPDPSLHTFQMVRIPAGSDCAYILQNRCALFVDVD